MGIYRPKTIAEADEKLEKIAQKLKELTIEDDYNDRDPKNSKSFEAYKKKLGDLAYYYAMEKAKLMAQA